MSASRKSQLRRVPHPAATRLTLLAVGAICCLVIAALALAPRSRSSSPAVGSNIRVAAEARATRDALTVSVRMQHFAHAMLERPHQGGESRSRRLGRLWARTSRDYWTFAGQPTSDGTKLLTLAHRNRPAVALALIQQAINDAEPSTAIGDGETRYLGPTGRPVVVPVQPLASKMLAAAGRAEALQLSLAAVTLLRARAVREVIDDQLIWNQTRRLNTDLGKLLARPGHEGTRAQLWLIEEHAYRRLRAEGMFNAYSDPLTSITWQTLDLANTIDSLARTGHLEHARAALQAHRLQLRLRLLRSIKLLRT